MNVGSLLAHHAGYRPDHLAVVCGEQRLTFRELAARVNRLANVLWDMGLRKGDALGILLPNGIELLDAYRAAAQLGLVAVPLSPLLRGAALASLLRDSNAEAMVFGHSLMDVVNEARHALPVLAANRCVAVGSLSSTTYADYSTLVTSASTRRTPPVAIDDDDPFNIIYSSGTTGLPKGITLTHRVRALYGSLFAAQFRVCPESVVLHGGSLVFNGAFVTLMPAWLTGCTYVLMERFDPVAFIDTVEREQVTHVMMVPSQIAAVLAAPNFSSRSLGSLEMLCSVGAPWHREHKARMLAALPNALYELYGLTEGFITVLDRTDFAEHLDSVGVPIPFSDLRIVGDDGRDVPAGGVGEIVGRSPLLMSGYHGRPDLTGAAIVDGWLHSGDVGRVDDRGFLHLVDRKKDMIISGGVNVFPKDIEEIAARHPAVREVAVFGVANEKWGESPVAAVILSRSGAVTAEALCQWINERVAARFQQLHSVVLVDEFPRSTAGKTLKRVLREQYAFVEPGHHRALSGA